MLHVLVVLSSGTEIRVHDFQTENQMPSILNLWHLTSQHSLLCTSYNTKHFLYSKAFILEVACWPLVPKFAGSHPAEAVKIFRAKKFLSTPSFGGEVKPSVPCRSFTACKRSLNVTCKSAFRQNSRTFLAHSSTFRRWVLSRGDAWWRKLERLSQIAQ